MQKRVFCSLLMLCFGLSSTAAQAQGTGLVVMRLRVSQLAILGRFATAQCTIQNAGKKAAALKAVAVVLITPNGQAKKFAVSPPGPRLGELSPGQSYSFRQFQQMNTPGEFSCAVQVEDGMGRWTSLPFADGRPAQAALRVIPAASVPRVQALLNPRGLPRRSHTRGYTARARSPLRGTARNG